jgi:hypothetical protein
VKWGKGFRRLLTLAVLSGTAASLWLFSAPSAHAVNNLETGVWWRNQTGRASLPAPPQVPAGGLWVSSDPTGPSAISAVRFTLAGTEGFPVLTLRVGRLTAQPGTPVTSGAVPIFACVLTGTWAKPPTFPGAWSARPSYDCAKGSVAGQMSPDLGAVVFNLTDLPAAHSYDLALVPGPPSRGIPLPQAPPLPVPVPVPLPVPSTIPDPTGSISSPTFDITFEPVTLSDLSVLPTAAPQAGESATAAPATSKTGTAVGPAPLGSLAVPTTSAAVAAPALAVPASGPVLAITPRSPVRRVTKVLGTSTVKRVIAGIVFCALAAWAWRLMAADSAAGIVVAGGREALTLYDSVPLSTKSGLRRRFTTSPRIGAPPALR